MSLDKAIAHKKEKRKRYRGSKQFFGSCRNHGSCPWCERNRRHKMRDKHPQTMEEAIEETAVIRDIPCPTCGNQLFRVHQDGCFTVSVCAFCGLRIWEKN